MKKPEIFRLTICADAERFSDFFDRDSLLIHYYRGQTRGSMDYLRFF
ncbi:MULTISPECIES: hypothetical protein [Anaerostipes]|uniref:GNAT family N-acetyltransferase n=1 Tax=Anaerostipes hominis (ex Lee et al. 2021) TaxID=2025494 RepID=A0ABV4DIB5_9FIRM|nr:MULTISPECIES: hypothetical protein [Anaerostipes]